MPSRTLRAPAPAALLLAAATSLLASAGCGDDDGVVRGAGSIDVPKPTTYYSPQEATAHGASPADASPAGR